MTKPCRILQCGSPLRLRSGQNLASARFEVRQTADVPNNHLANPFLPLSLLLSLLLFLVPGPASGQAAAEAAGTTSVAATTGSAAKVRPFPSDVTPGDKSKSPHLLAPTFQQSEVANRQSLEQNAGKHPGKLLLRSIPSGAQVWVNGMFVGHAPLLLIVAPGKYQVELRGQRMEYAAHGVDLLPDETRTVSLMLSARYPTHASVR
jgi:PEGA domain